MASKIKRAADKFHKWHFDNATYLFKLVNLSYWSADAKMIVYSLVTIGPCIITSMYALALIIFKIINMRLAKRPIIVRKPKTE